MKHVFTALLAVLLTVTSVSAQVGLLRRGTLDASGEAVTLRLDGVQSVGIGVANSGTYQLEFEVSLDGGATYTAVQATNVADLSLDANTTAPGNWVVANAGYTHLRVRASSYTGGAPAVTIARGYGDVPSAGATLDLGDAELSVGAQPANDPHFVRCSNGSAASPCLVTLSGTNNINNISGTVSLPTGAATAANQTTVIGHVDGIEGLLTTANTNTGNIVTAVQLIDNAVSGSGFNITQFAGAAVPMTTTQADNLALTLDGLNVSAFNYVYDGTNYDMMRGDATNGVDVDVTRIVPGTGATNLGKAEDAAHASGDTGVVFFGVRQDTQSDFGADGDYVPFSINADGELRVTMAGGSGGTALVDDADFTAGSGSFTPIGGFYQSSVTACTDGDACTARITSGRALTAHIVNADGSTASLAADATHDSAVLTAGPQTMGAASSTYPTAVGSGDAVRFSAGLDGIQIIRPYAHVGDAVNGRAAITDGSSTSVVAAQGSGVRFCATTVVVSNSSATGVTVDLRDGTGGSVLMTVPAPPDVSGAVVPLPTPLCTTANTALAADPSASASTVAVTAVGFRTAQ